MGRLKPALCEVKMVTLEKIKKAKCEVKRFLKALDTAEKKLKEDEMYRYGCRETASVKRASMDLSNILVAFRKSNA